MQLMDNWRTAGIPPSNRLAIPESVTRLSRTLQATSGNAQPYNLENLKPEEVKTQSGDVHLPLDFHPQHYPPPPTLRSNAPRPIGATQRLEQRRLHRTQVAARQVSTQATVGTGRSSGPIRRGYLNSRKYLEYRARPRRDTGKDGEPVWPDELEEVFQDALIAIPPMGRKKVSQGGKACGRNEMIAAYIEKWTGKERGRKQVSSHIQVLNQILKYDPEWIALIKETDQNDSSHFNYYLDSIGDLVAQRKFEAQNGNMCSSHTIPPYTGALPSQMDVLPFSGGRIKPAIMMSLDFVMWVNGPNQENRVEDAFHIYTRLQSDCCLPEEPLENVHNWRLSHPYLADLVDNPIEPLNCEIILLEASLHLMKDFPPSGSKLGIHNELDFLRGSFRGEPSDLVGWTCNTIFYENGEMVYKRDDAELQTSLPVQHESQGTTVSPAFEAGWWATLFTQITERRRRIEDSGDLAPEIVDEQSRQRLRQLTAVQEIRATPVAWSNSRRCSQNYRGRGDSIRVGIFLWKFRLTRENEVGTTFWQKLVPPPQNRMETNSPMPTDDLGLPPMTLDSVVSGSQDVIDGHQADHHGHRMVPIYDNGGWDDSALADHQDFDFFGSGVPGTGAEGDPTAIPEMSFNDHLDLGHPHSSHHHDPTDFQGSHIVILQDQYGDPHEQHLHPYPDMDHHQHDKEGSFHEHDLQSSNVTAAMFNHRLPNDTHHGNFTWDLATFDVGTDHISIDGCLGVGVVGGPRSAPRKKCVVEELFPEETGAEVHGVFEDDQVIQGEGRILSEIVE